MRTSVEQLMGRELSLACNRRYFRSLRRDMEAAGRSNATIATYNQGCVRLETWLLENGHNGDLAEVTRDLASAWIIGMSKAGYSKDSIVTYFRSVRRFYNFLAEDEVIAESPLKKLAEPKPEAAPVSFPDIEAVRQLLAACKPPKGSKPTFRDLRDEMIIRLFCETGGARCGEVAALPLAALDLEDDSIRIRGKGGKWRAIALSPKTAKACERYLRARKDHPYAAQDWLVLGHSGGMNPNGIWQMIQRRCRAAGIEPLHPHQFRHLAADQAKSAGMSDGDMMRLFGWSSHEMLNRYGAAQADRRAMEASRKLSLGNTL